MHHYQRESLQPHISFLYSVSKKASTSFQEAPPASFSLKETNSTRMVVESRTGRRKERGQEYNFGAGVCAKTATTSITEVHQNDATTTSLCETRDATSSEFYELSIDTSAKLQIVDCTNMMTQQEKEENRDKKLNSKTIAPKMKKPWQQQNRLSRMARHRVATSLGKIKKAFVRKNSDKEPLMNSTTFQIKGKGKEETFSADWTNISEAIHLQNISDLSYGTTSSPPRNFILL